MVRTVAVCTYLPKRHHNSQQRAPKRKYCTPHAAIRSLKVMTVCLFHVCTWIQSCSPNNRPSNVIDPTKITGCRKSDMERFGCFGDKFSCVPALSVRIARYKIIRNLRVVIIGLQQSPRERWLPRLQGSYVFGSPLYRRTPGSQSDAQTSFLLRQTGLEIR